uniref:Uncharacterized protein n=1 Tax=Theropithecus gelada TaxID=9565 RepID=A0A8D2EZZ1_THEGE
IPSALEYLLAAHQNFTSREGRSLTNNCTPWKAEYFKEQGNAYYVKKDYNEAYNYTKALGICPKNTSYYSNQAATLIMLGRFQEALGDAHQSLRLDDSFVQGHLGEGNFQREFKNANSIMEYEKLAKTDFEKHDIRKVVLCMDCALLLAPACHCFKILKAEYLVMLGHIQKHNLWPVTFYKWSPPMQILCMCKVFAFIMKIVLRRQLRFLYRLSGWLHERACIACRNPKALKAKKGDRNKAFKEGNYKLAYELYMRALG